jgi:hypothetical protein
MRTAAPSGPTIWLPRALRKPAGSRPPVKSGGNIEAPGGPAAAARSRMRKLRVGSSVETRYSFAMNTSRTASRYLSPFTVSGSK